MKKRQLRKGKPARSESASIEEEDLHEQNIQHSMTSAGAPSTQREQLVDSAEPPPPQLRRARSTYDPSKSPKDKNTGIKHRDASGKKHPLQPKQSPTD